LSSGVTAVFQGDAHYYDYTVEDGLPYVISGGAGSPLYKNPFNPEWSVNEALLVTVGPNEVGFQSISADGNILDRRTLKARPMTMPAVQSAPVGAVNPVVAQTDIPQSATANSDASLWLGGAVLLGLLLGAGIALLILRIRPGLVSSPTAGSTTESRH